MSRRSTRSPPSRRGTKHSERFVQDDDMVGRSRRGTRHGYSERRLVADDDDMSTLELDGGGFEMRTMTQPSPSVSHRSRSGTRPSRSRGRSRAPSGTGTSSARWRTVENEVDRLAADYRKKRRRRRCLAFSICCALCLIVLSVLAAFFLVNLLPLQRAHLSKVLVDVGSGLCGAGPMAATVSGVLSNPAGATVVLQPFTAVLKHGSVSLVEASLMEPLSVPPGDSVPLLSDQVSLKFVGSEAAFSELVQMGLDSAPFNLTLVAQLTVTAYAGVRLSVPIELDVPVNQDRSVGDSDDDDDDDDRARRFRLFNFWPTATGGTSSFELGSAFGFNNSLPLAFTLPGAVSIRLTGQCSSITGVPATATTADELAIAQVDNVAFVPAWNNYTASVAITRAHAPAVGALLGDFVMRKCPLTIEARVLQADGDEPCWLIRVLSRVVLSIHNISSSTSSPSSSSGDASPSFIDLRSLQFLPSTDGSDIPAALTIGPVVGGTADLLSGVWPRFKLGFFTKDKQMFASLAVENFRFDPDSLHSLPLSLSIVNGSVAYNGILRPFIDGAQPLVLLDGTSDWIERSSVFQVIVSNLRLQLNFTSFLASNDGGDDVEQSNSGGQLLQSIRLVEQNSTSLMFSIELPAFSASSSFELQGALGPASLFVVQEWDSSVASRPLVSSLSVQADFNNPTRISVRAGVHFDDDDAVSRFAEFVSSAIKDDTGRPRALRLRGQSDQLLAGREGLPAILSAVDERLVLGSGVDGSGDSSAGSEFYVELGSFDHVDAILGNSLIFAMVDDSWPSFDIDSRFFEPAFSWQVTVGADNASAHSPFLNLTLSDVSGSESRLSATLNLTDIDPQSGRTLLHGAFNSSASIRLLPTTAAAPVDLIHRIASKISFEVVVGDSGGESSSGVPTKPLLALSEIRVLGQRQTTGNVSFLALQAEFTSGAGSFLHGQLPAVLGRVSSTVVHCHDSAGACDFASDSRTLATLTVPPVSLTRQQSSWTVPFFVSLQEPGEIIDAAFNGSQIDFAIGGRPAPSSSSSQRNVLQLIFEQFEIFLASWQPPSAHLLQNETELAGHQSFLSFEVLNSTKSTVTSELQLALNASLNFRVTFGKLSGRLLLGGNETLVVVDARHVELVPGSQNITALATLLAPPVLLEQLIDDFINKRPVPLVFEGQLTGVDASLLPAPVDYSFQLVQAESLVRNGTGNEDDGSGLGSLVPCVETPEFEILSSLLQVIFSSQCSLDLEVEFFLFNPLPIALTLQRVTGFVAIDSPGVPLFYPGAKKNVRFGAVDVSPGKEIEAYEIHPQVVSLLPYGNIEACARVTSLYLGFDEVELKLQEWTVDLALGLYEFNVYFEANLTVPVKEDMAANKLTCREELNL